MRIPILLLLPTLALALPNKAHADSMTIEFATDGGTTNCLTGSSLTATRVGLSLGGITFDATLTVIGSATLAQSSTGLGVVNTRINAGESLAFSMAISNVSSGLVTFDGFTGIDFNSFSENEKAEFDEAGSIFLTYTSNPGSSDVDLSSTSPMAFTLFGRAGTGITTSFSVDDVSGMFTATAAVPEPGSLALLSLGLGTAALFRRRRRAA